MSKLFVISTPIGNLSDISARAVDSLRMCDVVACEDTRVSGKLLQMYEISKQMIAYRDDNEQEKAKYLLELLKSGKNIALISDAGAPGLSDPGFRIVRECRKNGIEIVPIPGACSLISALTCSGLPTNGFLFLGFLPAKASARLKTFEKFKEFEYTLCFFESCHRIDKFLSDASEIFEPTRVICVAKEITKLHETFIVGKLHEVIEKFKSISQKGEFVVCIAPSTFDL